MSDVRLNEHQLDAIEKMRTGCILVGEGGSGKSRTALAYYFMKVCGAELTINGIGDSKPMKNPRDLYIITTAKKRDDGDWLDELFPFTDPWFDQAKVTVDSWNNIKKYKDVYGAFFIFDEQRLVGNGTWVKTFYNIARKNQWVLLSGTPGDKWLDYIPVFVANGFYRNKTEFNRMHCVYSPYITKYPKLEGYVNTKLLNQHKFDISIPLPVDRKTQPHNIGFTFSYDKELYKTVWKDRKDPYNDCPIEETGTLMYLLRKVVNQNEDRLRKVLEIIQNHQRVIVFYNYNYELDDLRKLCREHEIAFGEWNGDVHSPIPDTERWAYLVQYIAGCEGWNCLTSNCMIFYSQTYSYKQLTQAKWRIDRLTTPFKDLWYYHFKSSAPIDLAIARSLAEKKEFNERKFLKGGGKV